MWSPRQLLLLLLSITAIAKAIYTGCFTSQTSAYNLETADPIELYPYFVSMEYNNSSFCGATIISTKFVVTAASCIPPTGSKNLTLRACSNTRNQGGKSYRIKDIVIHPQYNSTRFGRHINDIALMKLRGKFGWRKRCRPIVFDPAPGFKVGSISVVTGMGEIENGTRSNLLSVEIPIVDRETCKEIYKDVGGIADDQMCTGLCSKKGPCRGDEGSPLVFNEQLIGVYSKWSNRTCGDLHHPDVFTNITHHYEWIAKIIRVPD